MPCRLLSRCCVVYVYGYICPRVRSNYISYILSQRLTLQAVDEMKMFRSSVESLAINYANALDNSQLVIPFDEAAFNFAGYDVVSSIQPYKVTND